MKLNSGGGVVSSHSIGNIANKFYNYHSYIQKCVQVGPENIKIKWKIWLHVQIMNYNYKIIISTKCAKQISSYESASKITS